jgi:hypothetical protein
MSENSSFIQWWLLDIYPDSTFSKIPVKELLLKWQFALDALMESISKHYDRLLE